LLILVEIDKAWKNEIYDGSKPVEPAGTTTVHGANIPTLAYVLTFNDSIFGLTSKAASFVKINPTLPLHY